MSLIPKTGTSRIPTFNPRSTDLEAKLVVPPPSDITAKHVGNRVRVGDKEGILRFVGEVHFSKGTWCGIELSESIGKNDGVVNGVRYFACSERRGLMAPLAKVSLVNTRENDASGPYSMLFIDTGKKPQRNTAEDFITKKESQRNDITKKLHDNLRDTFNTFTQAISNTIKQQSDNKKRLSELIVNQSSNKQSDKKDDDISTYFPLDKSCEDILKDSTLEVKRRRTSNPKVQKHEVLRSLSDNIEKPSSLPQLKFLSNSFTALGKINSLTPIPKKETKDCSSLDDDSKRDSLDLDESLGILTPQFMNSNKFNFDYDKNTNKILDIDSPKDDSLGLLDETLLNLPLNKAKNNQDIPQKEDIPSPNITDYSLGIIDDNVLANITMKTDTTVNMELPLDMEKTILTRMEQTPSPEELPLDPTPVVESDSKTEPSTSKSKTCNSFINSITSITSLDTGYQGDGEMSRPASRGADNSPLTRRPVARPQNRRIDPMTDSDFYTESDADNHEENPLRGDRKAQVIDGTLYGVDPQAAADIYVNNRENMDSSGIFTDIESNTRNDDDFNQIVTDVSPSDTSSKTISENSQQIVKNNEVKQDDPPVVKDNPKKRNAPSPGISSPSTFSSPRHRNKEDNSAKKYKMPKREVTSKVKAMLEPTNEQNSGKKLVKKTVGRWDAVMSKISKNEQNKTNLKEVKSKVFDEVNVNTGLSQRKIVTRNPGNQKNPNSKLNVSTTSTASTQSDLSGASKKSIRSPQQNPKRFKTEHRVALWGVKRKEPQSKLKPLTSTSTSKVSKVGNTNLPVDRRRIRNRPNSGSPKTISGNNLAGSIHSSLSDVSAATLPPNNKKIGAAKKRDVVQVTQVLTANKLQSRGQQQTVAENKKNVALHSSPRADSKTGRKNFSLKEKQSTIKECARGTVKGGRTSPIVRPPQIIKSQEKQPPVAEALAILVQHLVFNVKAYQVPNLKRQVDKFKSEHDKIKSACQQLEEALSQEKNQRARDVEEKHRCLQLVEKHMNEVAELNQQYANLEQHYLSDVEAARQKHEEQLAAVRKEFEESLNFLREENESVREQIDEKNVQIDRVKYESKKLKDEYETKECVLKEHNQKLKQQINKLETDYEARLKGLVEENKRFREENDRLLGYGDDKGIQIQEVQSLRAVLELKQNEVAELRRSLAEVTQRAEILIGAEERARVLNARCEDLQLQLQRKIDTETLLKQENQKLQEIFKEETNQKRRLSQYNEELQWKLKHNKEVINKVLEQAEETVFNRKMMSSSFNERHSATRLQIERSMSFRERSYSNRSSINGDEKGPRSMNNFQNDDDLSPPSTPKVKGIVEKSDSVSYVLEMNESPEEVANRIVRRSFRGSTPAKCTPTKSPSNKRPRIRTPLCQSSSTSAILSNTKNELDRPLSANSRSGDSDDSVFMWPNTERISRTKIGVHDHLDLDEDNDEDLQLPALPSELDRRNGAQALPSPKHLAGEAMISESNSEDESTSSSQL